MAKKKLESPENYEENQYTVFKSRAQLVAEGFNILLATRESIKSDSLCAVSLWRGVIAMGHVYKTNKNACVMCLSKHVAARKGEFISQPWKTSKNLA